MLKGFIDAHVHLNVYTPAVMELAEAREACLLSINTDVPVFPSLKAQANRISEFQRNWPHRIRHITSFESRNWQSGNWTARAIDQIKKGIDQGAVGVKIWKNIGMDPDLRYPDGRFLMIDDPRLTPILEFIVASDLLLIAHLGEPKNAWLPLEEMTVDSDRAYFGAHPEYHMFRHPEYPSYLDQIRARDQILDRYPTLRFVGLHLLSLEWNLAEVGKRLDRYPQIMTDLAERICHLQWQCRHDSESVRNFFLRYQDRIIYGTDFILWKHRRPAEVCKDLAALWDSHYTFFATRETMTAPQFSGSFRGLGLPLEVLNKLFFENAARTYGFR